MTKRPQEIVHLQALPHDMLSKIIMCLVGSADALVTEGRMAMVEALGSRELIAARGETKNKKKLQSAMAAAGRKKMEVRADYEYRILSLLGDWFCVRLVCRSWYDRCTFIMRDWASLAAFGHECDWFNNEYEYFMHSRHCRLSRSKLLYWLDYTRPVPVGVLPLRELIQYKLDERLRHHITAVISAKLEIK